MSEVAGKKRKTTDEEGDAGPAPIEDAQQFYEFVVSGGFGPVFAKPGDSNFPDLSAPPMWAALSRGTVIEKSEAIFGNVAPVQITSVVRDRNKITGLNVGGTSVPSKRFTNISAVLTAKRLGADLLLLCNGSYLAIPPLQIDGLNNHVGTATITYTSKGDGLGELFMAMGKCLATFGVNLTAGQLKSLCERAVTVVNLAKTNMKFWTDELAAVLNATDKKELLSSVTKQRSAAKVSDSVLQFCAQLVSVTHADNDPEQFLEILTEFDNPKMAISALTMFGKFPLPSIPKAKDKGMLFVNERGTPLEVKKLSEVEESDIVLVNDGAIVAESQVLSLLSCATTVYVKPPGTTVFFKGKGKNAKYEERKWSSLAAKPILGLVKMLVAGGLGAPGTSGAKEVGVLLPADNVDED